VLAFATIRSPRPSEPASTETAADETDPAVECPACPVLTPHIRPR